MGEGGGNPYTNNQQCISARCRKISHQGSQQHNNNAPVLRDVCNRGMDADQRIWILLESSSSIGTYSWIIASERHYNTQLVNWGEVVGMG